MATSLDEICSTNYACSENEVDYSLQGIYNDLIRESTIYILKLRGGKLVYHKIQEEFDARQCEIYIEHFRHYVRKQIFGSPAKTDDRSFADIIRHFQANEPRKKLFCRYGNIYLVKKYFTEGVQYVNQGEIHTYEAIGKPLDIYISKLQLEKNTFEINYEAYTNLERISPGETKNISPNTYYFVVAKCHTLFKRMKISTPEVEILAEISPSFATEAGRQVTNTETEDRNGIPSIELINSLNRISTLPQPSGSRDDGHSNPRHFMEFVNDSASRGTRISSTENDRQLIRTRSSTAWTRASTLQAEVALVCPSPNTLTNELEVMRRVQATNASDNGDRGRAVFAIRKDSNIEPYTLRMSTFSSDSTFCILQGDKVAGSFAIENNDMDPYVIEYHGGLNFIREVARFKNGSMLETTLAVQEDLLNELRHSNQIENVVVNYFFEFAFKSIEAAYQKFSEMRNVKMIGSCVPAIVPLNDARFCGAVSDVYEAKG